MAPPVTRRAARQARRRQQHRRVGLAGGIAIGVAAVVVIAATVFGVNKAVNHHSGSKRTQSTVLLQVQGSNRSAAASVLLAHNPSTKSGVEVLVPNRVITNVCGYGQQNFGAVLALPNGASASQQALSGMLDNITIDGSWVLSPAQLAKLIDVFGGVTVDVDTNVVQHTAGGGAKVLIPAGNHQHLDGAKAVEYALYTTSAQANAAAELTRLNRVMDGMLQAFPTTPAAIAAALRQLGTGGGSTLGATKLSTLLAGLAADARSSSGLFPTDLPIVPLNAGGSSPSYEVDTTATGVPQLVHTQLADSLPAGNQTHQTSVLLLNGLGTPGLVTSACPRIASHGFINAGSGNASSFTNDLSQVEVKSNADVSIGDQIAHALGLPTSDVVRTTEDESVADVIVVLGRDYQP
jgi:hypothetical protein